MIVDLKDPNPTGMIWFKSYFNKFMGLMKKLSKSNQTKTNNFDQFDFYSLLKSNQIDLL